MNRCSSDRNEIYSELCGVDMIDISTAGKFALALFVLLSSFGGLAGAEDGVDVEEEEEADRSSARWSFFEGADSLLHLAFFVGLSDEAEEVTPPRRFFCGDRRRRFFTFSFDGGCCFSDTGPFDDDFEWIEIGDDDSADSTSAVSAAMLARAVSGHVMM